MACSLFTIPYITFLGLSLLLIAGLAVFLIKRMNNQNNKFSSIVGVVTSMAEELNRLKSLVTNSLTCSGTKYDTTGGSTKEIHLSEPSLVAVSDEDDDDEDDEDEDDDEEKDEDEDDDDDDDDEDDDDEDEDDKEDDKEIKYIHLSNDTQKREKEKDIFIQPENSLHFIDEEPKFEIVEQKDISVPKEDAHEHIESQSPIEVEIEEILTKVLTEVKTEVEVLTEVFTEIFTEVKTEVEALPEVFTEILTEVEEALTEKSENNNHSQQLDIDIDIDISEIQPVEEDVVLTTATNVSSSKVNYKKLSLDKLRSLVTEKGLGGGSSDDFAKLKKADLVKLLEA